MIFYTGTASNYAREQFEDAYYVPDCLRFYFDYDTVAHDIIIDSEIVELASHLNEF